MFYFIRASKNCGNIWILDTHIYHDFELNFRVHKILKFSKIDRRISFFLLLALSCEYFWNV